MHSIARQKWKRNLTNQQHKTLKRYLAQSASAMTTYVFRSQNFLQIFTLSVVNRNRRQWAGQLNISERCTPLCSSRISDLACSSGPCHVNTRNEMPRGTILKVTKNLTGYSVPVGVQQTWQVTQTRPDRDHLIQETQWNKIFRTVLLESSKTMHVDLGERIEYV